MKAIVQDAYGPPGQLALRDIERPVAGDDEVLVRVCAASVNPPDVAAVTGVPYIARVAFGVRRPQPAVRGSDLAGIVQEVGQNVSRLHPGDEVFGSGTGTFAEFAVASERNLVPKPDNLTFEQAAATPMSMLTALTGLRDLGKVKAGQQVLIIGAGGGIGTFAVQIATSMGAEVTGVCSTAKADLVRSIGADRVVDYTQEDFAVGGQRYDVILDNVSKRSLSRLLKTLTPSGVLVPNGGRFDKRWLANAPVLLVEAPLLSLVAQRNIHTVRLAPNPGDWLVLKELLESGKVRPVVGRTYPLGETSEAVRHLAQGHARGKIVITV